VEKADPSSSDSSSGPWRALECRKVETFWAWAFV
jgi:hypothetical protein